MAKQNRMGFSFTQTEVWVLYYALVCTQLAPNMVKRITANTGMDEQDIGKLKERIGGRLDALEE